MATVSPKLSTTPSIEMRRRLVAAGDAQRTAAEELQAAVLDATRAGVSVREIAALADISTNTVQRWRKAAGL